MHVCSRGCVVSVGTGVCRNLLPIAFPTPALTGHWSFAQSRNNPDSHLQPLFQAEFTLSPASAAHHKFTCLRNTIYTAKSQSSKSWVSRSVDLTAVDTVKHKLIHTSIIDTASV